MNLFKIIKRRWRRFFLGSYITELEKQNKDLRERLKQIGYEINTLQFINTYRNKQLDALHIVWCNGGCNGGIGCKDKVNEELVLEAERNVKRIRQWWENKKWKGKWATMTKEERDAYHAAFKVNR